jgi:aconitate hydratase
MKDRSSLGPLLALLPATQERVQYVSLERAEALGICSASRLPLTLKILLESTLRHAEDLSVLDLSALTDRPRRANLEFRPARLLLQDFTGVPLMTDLASLRDEVAARGGDPRRVNPTIPIDFVCDHALIAEYGGRPDAMALNERIEVERNRERFEFLKWCSEAFSKIRLIPPGSGIMHQLNLEWLSTVVWLEDVDGLKLARPDTLLGTDSHTPMVGGLGVLGWGVGGIEAQAAMLGQSTLVNAPRVVGMRLSGTQSKGVTATDIVLHVAQFLRGAGVVNSFIEVFGDAVSALPIETRATIANMAPEYGATSVYFPVDEASLKYLRLTGRDEACVSRIEAYAKAQGLWQGPDSDEGIYDAVLEFDLSKVEPALAGPKRPEQKTSLSKLPESFRAVFKETPLNQLSSAALKAGDVVIAAITSCTNTANPSVMIGAGLLARNAVRLGLSVKPWVKTSLAPGSRVVGDYLAAAGLQPYLDALGFQIIGYGCTTCNGNSGALAEEITKQIITNHIPAVAVLSGNRNFAGRIHPLVPASYLASPALVVAYAIAGTVLTDLSREPLGKGKDGKPVMLADIWPADEEIAALLSHVTADKYQKAYRSKPVGHADWSAISAAKGVQFPWVPGSTFITPSPLNISAVVQQDQDSIVDMRALAILGDGITTDTLSPNGEILTGTPAALFLAEHGIKTADFGNYAARRGSFEIAVRGMFTNPHIENEMLAGERGPCTLLLPEGRQTTIFDAGMAYIARGTPAMIIAGKGYGSGSSRDWAAKGVRHLGVRVVLAESFERIHRANLVGVGILPVTFVPEMNRKTLGLTGRERFRLGGLRDGLSVGGRLQLEIVRENSAAETVPVIVNLETGNEIHILRTGGLLPFLLREFAAAS